MSDLHVMIDLETTGTRAGCGILTIGACTFDLQKTFEIQIDPENCRLYLKEDIETMRWWSKQSDEARKMAFSGTSTLLASLNQFSDWMGNLPESKANIKVWGNGADFDLPILQAAYAVFDLPTPWAPFSGRCLRTLRSLLPHVQKPEFKGVRHSALADAMNQAEHAMLLLQAL